MSSTSDQLDKDDGGLRAEEVASWYFRLNGFMYIPGFVLHPDVVRSKPRTEADLLGVRFPHTTEILDGRPMTDDPCFAASPHVLFVMVEVKWGICSINPQWIRRGEANMQRAIRRLGFAREPQIEHIADSMYADLRWENGDYALQYIAVGRKKNHQLQKKHGGLMQVTWTQIGEFLRTRFSEFPMKLRDGMRVHEQWPPFGKEYGRWFREMSARETSLMPIDRYVKTGSCMKAQRR